MGGGINVTKEASKILKSKEQLIQYLTSFDIPTILIQKRHDAIYYNNKEQRFKWHISFLKGCSLPTLVDTINFLEKYTK
jgi:hypothetical protein